MILTKQALLIIGWAISLCSSTANGDDKIWFLEGEELQIRMDTKAVIACSAQVAFGIQSYYSWSEAWGGGYWIIRTSSYAEFCFDPYWTADYPKPYASGTLIFYSVYYGRADTIRIVMVPAGKPYSDGAQCVMEADPVLPQTGNFLNSQFGETDILLPSRGLNIEFKRIYASQERENPDTLGSYAWMRPIGSGWTHSYNISLKVINDYYNSPYDWSVLLYDHDGNEKLLSWTGSVYTSEKGEHLLLQRTGASPNFQWILSRGDGSKWYFRQRSTLIGRLDSIIDANGNKITLTYTGNNLTKIKEPLVREINITYYPGSSLIKRVYEPPNMTDGLYCEYFYRKNGATYDLTRVVRHNPGTNDSTTLSRYFYNNKHNLHTYIFPTGKYNENNDTSWHYKKGDRVNCWYDDKNRCIYQEVVQADGDTLLTNDRVVYRARMQYFINVTTGYPDSTRIYYYEDTTYTSALNPLTDPAPTPPTSNHIRKTIRFSQNGTVVWEKIYQSPSGLSMTTTYGTYDADLNPASITDPDNKTTYYAYHSYADASGGTRYLNHPKKVKYATGDSLLYYYSPYASNARFFLMDSSRDELSRKTNYFYNTQGSLDSTQCYQRILADGGASTPQNVNTKFTHNVRGNLTEVRDPELHRNYLHYIPNDTGAYLTESRIDIGNNGEDHQDLVTQYRYNANRGTIDTLIYYHDFPANPIKVNYYYDLLARLCKIAYPDNTNEEYVYDKRGNFLEKKITKTGTAYYKIQYEYDARNRLKKVKEFKDLVNYPTIYDSTLYVYSLNDALTEFSNANDGATNTTIHYDYVANRLYRTRYADNNKDSLGYYLSGYLKFKKDRRGKVIEYKYDDRWRLTKKRYFDDWTSYPNSPTDSVVFWLDKVGNLDSLLEKNGKIKYDYDGLDRLFELNAFNSRMVKYLYDKVSNRTRMKVCKSSDTTIVYLEQTYPSYDEANRLLKTAVSLDTFEFTYWDTGPMREIGYPNDLKEQYWLTARNNVDSLRTYYLQEQSTLFKSVYKYNSLADRESMYVQISRPQQAAFTGTIRYSYDNLRRITNSKSYISGIASIVYTYDPVGNRLSKKVGTETCTYTYDKQTNHLTQTQKPNHTYIYDANGNTTFRDSTSRSYRQYYWDFENRLIACQTWANDPGYPGDSVYHVYCALGKRIAKHFYDWSTRTTDTTKYTYDGIYVVCEFGGHDNLKNKYVYANGLLLGKIDSAGVKHFYHHDALGSTMGLTDVNKAVVQSYFYDDFGNLWGSWGTVSQNYLYTGQEYDSSPLWLHNLRARYYASDIARFVSEDPVCLNTGAPQMMNLYLYAENNPINWIDIWGLYTICYPLVSIPGLWRDIGAPEFLSSEWMLIHARQERGRVLPGIMPLRCVFMELLKFIQQQSRTWYTLIFCTTIEPCYSEFYFKTSSQVGFRYVPRTKIGKKKEIGFDYSYPVIPQIECWNLFKGETP